MASVPPAAGGEARLAQGPGFSLNRAMSPPKLHAPWRRNILFLTLIRINFSMMFAVPVIALYWKGNGLSVLDIFLLQAVFSFTVVLLEIPTGFLGDRLGRKRTILLSAAVHVAGWLLYAAARSFWFFAIAEITLGLSVALLSGTDSSFVFESLAAMKREDFYSKIEGRILGLHHLGAAVSSVAGGVLAAFVPVWWLMTGTAALAAVSFMLALGLREPVRETYRHPRGTWYGFYKILRYVFLKSKIVRAALPLLAACSLATMLGVWLYQPFWEARAVPVWLFGVLWASLFLPSSLGSHFAHKLEKFVGRRAIIFLLPLPPLLGYCLAALLPGYWALAPIYLVNLLYGMAPPILGRYIQEETHSDKRATVFSIGSFVFRIAYCGCGPLVGLVAKNAGLEPAFLVSAGIGVSCILLLIPFFLHKLKNWPESPSGKDVVRPAKTATADRGETFRTPD